MKQLTLADGRTLHYAIRQSARAKYLRMQLHPDKGLVVTQPPGVCEHRLHDWVLSKRDWIAETLSKVGQPTPPPADACPLPERLELLATGESLRVIYTPTARKNIALDYADEGTLTLSGAVGNAEHCQYALRQWLRTYAQVHLGRMLQQLAAETGLALRQLQREGAANPLGKLFDTRQYQPQLQADFAAAGMGAVYADP